MKEGTTKNLLTFRDEEGQQAYEDWMSNKLACLEELVEAGFDEAIPALKALERTYRWIEIL